MLDLVLQVGIDPAGTLVPRVGMHGSNLRLAGHGREMGGEGKSPSTHGPLGR